MHSKYVVICSAQYLIKQVVWWLKYVWMHIYIHLKCGCQVRHLHLSENFYAEITMKYTKLLTHILWLYFSKLYRICQIQTESFIDAMNLVIMEPYSKLSHKYQDLPLNQHFQGCLDSLGISYMNGRHNKAESMEIPHWKRI